MDDIEETLRDLNEMGDVESQFLNCEEAKQFISTCTDPIVRELLWTAYSVLTFRMAQTEIDGKFDVLFFVKVISEMAVDPQRLIQVLSGNYTPE